MHAVGLIVNNSSMHLFIYFFCFFYLMFNHNVITRPSTENNRLLSAGAGLLHLVLLLQAHAQLHLHVNIQSPDSKPLPNIFFCFDNPLNSYTLQYGRRVLSLLLLHLDFKTGAYNHKLFYTFINCLMKPSQCDLDKTYS